MPSPWLTAFERGQARHAPLAWDASAFETRARAALARRLAPLGVTADDAALAAVLAASAVEDLWLATAVEGCVRGSEAHLRRTLAPPLEALALQRGLVAARARSESARLLDDVLGAPGSAAAGRLGGYDGSADLLAWLAAMLEEREQARAAEPAPGEAAAPASGPDRPHPSALFLAAAAQGRLLEGEQQPFARHVVGCARCQAHLKGLTLAGVPPAAAAAAAGPDPLAPVPRLRPPIAPPPPRRVGAVLLSIGVVLGVIALALKSGGRSIFSLRGRGDDTESGVYAAARTLARQEPGFFADFLPYPLGQLEGAPTRPPGIDGSAVDLLHPLEDVLSTTPTLLWRPIEGVAGYVVTLRRAEGEPVWERKTAAHELAWPAGEAPLARDERYVWQVRVEAAGELVAQAPFRVASERQWLHWERRSTRIASLDADEAVRRVLLAQVALHRGHLWEAWEAIRAHVRRTPDDAYGRAFADYVRRMHGMID